MKRKRVKTKEVMGRMRGKGKGRFEI